jgi:hypothetical protein
MSNYDGIVGNWAKNGKNVLTIYYFLSEIWWIAVNISIIMLKIFLAIEFLN